MLRALLQSSIAATHSIAWNLKDLIPATECDLFKFATAADLIQWEVYSDAENGGMTTASFQSNVDLGTDMLQCELNIMNSVRFELMEHANTRMRRSGFSGIRTVQDINTIVMRVKENWRVPQEPQIPTHGKHLCLLHRMNARYLPTWKGKIVESDAEMNAACVTGMGLSLTAEGGPEGGEEGPGPSVWN
ncbi:unnamed protein product [Sphagnum troendelagicum]